MTTLYPHFHGEIKENKYVAEVLRSYFPDYSYKGVFFDIGAFDPIEISNSYHFEQNGWDCYLFEANPDLIPNLQSKRAHVYNYALYDTDKEQTTFHVVHNGTWTAGFSAIELSADYEKRFPCNTKTIKTVQVPQKKLNTVLASELPHIKNIDIMSIDIEGGELKMLQGFDLQTYGPKVIVIENALNDSAYKKYLESYGYTLDQHISYNQYYVKTSS